MSPWLSSRLPFFRFFWIPSARPLLRIQILLFPIFRLGVFGNGDDFHPVESSRLFLTAWNLVPYDKKTEVDENGENDTVEEDIFRKIEIHLKMSCNRVNLWLLLAIDSGVERNPLNFFQFGGSDILHSGQS